MRCELICQEPLSPPRLQVRENAMPEPRRGQVLVRVEATSINPIDAKRAGGYGQRLLGLKGAARARQRSTQFFIHSPGACER
jgi:NADPH:quinone reductase-like Zn-dependent oxidoreductase